MILKQQSVLKPKKKLKEVVKTITAEKLISKQLFGMCLAFSKRNDCLTLWKVLNSSLFCLCVFHRENT